jgi:hypothetical protein
MKKELTFEESIKTFKQIVEQYFKDLSDKNLEIVIQHVSDDPQVYKLNLLIMIENSTKSICRLDSKFNNEIQKDIFDGKYPEYLKNINVWSLHEFLLFEWTTDLISDKELEKIYSELEDKVKIKLFSDLKLIDVLKFYRDKTEKLIDNLYHNDLFISFSDNASREDGDIFVKVFLRKISDKRIIRRTDMPWPEDIQVETINGECETFSSKIDENKPIYLLKDLLLNNLPKIN